MFRHLTDVFMGETGDRTPRKMTRTTRHLIGREFESHCDFYREKLVPGRVGDALFVNRLNWLVTPKLEYNRVNVARKLARHRGSPHIFVDSSLFDNNTEGRFWDVLFSGRNPIAPCGLKIMTYGRTATSRRCVTT